jgi:hypothetical protein
MQGQHVAARDIGHEAKTPLVDADQGHPITGQLACGIEHGAVATDDDRHVGVRTEPRETAARPTSQVQPETTLQAVSSSISTVMPRSCRYLASKRIDSAISGLWYFPISAIVRGGWRTISRSLRKGVVHGRIKPQFRLASAAPRE